MSRDVRYHSSSGFCGGGTGGKLSLSSSSLSLCRWASLLSIIFWVKSTRNRPSVSSSSALQENLMVTSSKIFRTHCIRSVQTLLTWEVSFCHLFVKSGLFFQLASITKKKKRINEQLFNDVFTAILHLRVFGPTLNYPSCSAPRPAALHPSRLLLKHQDSVYSRYLASREECEVG